MKKISLLFISILFASVSLFAEIKILSPVEGTWANKQMLVIEDKGDGDYFYSLNGSDPEKFGFAYDGPVLIDLTDTVNLKVAHLAKDGSKDAASVTFTVKLDDGIDSSYKDFVKLFYQSGFVSYSSGTYLTIPANLKYSLENPTGVFIPGKSLYISGDSVLIRNLPCTVLDSEKNIQYRFIIKTYPSNAGIYSKREVPFTVTDWEKITFTDNNLLYKIDSEYWGLPTEPRILDRSVSHMISWQNLDYKEGNPVEFFVLPPKAEIIEQKKDDGSLVYTIKGDESYTMSVFSPEKGDYTELFTRLGADVFYGDKATGKLDIGVFSNSVYQGNIIKEYNIDKLPATAPQIKSTAKSFYTRDKVRIDVSADDKNELYIALSEPFILPPSEDLYTADSPALKNISSGQYKKIDSGKYSINWGPRGTGPVYYKISAYTKKGKSTSEIAEYSVIIDQSSYYFDEKADASLAEGTAEHPFTSFDQCVKDLAGVRAVRLKVKGNLLIEKKYQLDSNFEFIDNGNAKIIFDSGSCLAVKGSSLEFYNCQISNNLDPTKDSSSQIFKLENAVLTMEDCILSGNFPTNANAIDSYNSIINISDCVISINASVYASFISSVKSRISIKSSSISTSAETCVVISANEGNLNCSDSSLSVTGQSGRIAELFKVKGSITKNTFKAQLANKNQKIEAIYKNAATSVTETDNKAYGF